jgi:hypothetical protein
MALEKKDAAPHSVPYPSTDFSKPSSTVSASQRISIDFGTIDILLLFGLFLGCSLPYRVTVGTMTFGLAELFAFLFILWRWRAGGEGIPGLRGKELWLVRGFWAFAIWSGFVWLLSMNWLERREMVFDWIVAALLITLLLQSEPKDWKRVAVLYVLAALPNILLGILQRALGIGLQPKDFTGWRRYASTLPITGFFNHSNDLAAYLYWPFLISAGLTMEFRRWRRVFFATVTLLCGLVLYGSISRSTLLTLGAILVALALMKLLPERGKFRIAILIFMGIAVLGLATVFLTQPLRSIDRFLSGRLNLWNRALQVITNDRLLLPMGFISNQPNGASIWWLPHNIYILSWIEFGMPGFLLLLGLGAFLLRWGWQRYEAFRGHLPGALLWLGIGGLFLLNGMDSLYFHEPYAIINFICVAAIWIAQLREIDLSSSASNTGLPDGQRRNGEKTENQLK